MNSFFFVKFLHKFVLNKNPYFFQYPLSLPLHFYVALSFFSSFSHVSNHRNLHLQFSQRYKNFLITKKINFTPTLLKTQIAKFEGTSNDIKLQNIS